MLVIVLLLLLICLSFLGDKFLIKWVINLKGLTGLSNASFLFIT
jgi:hypothetical protein